jgi:sulfide dehydrogenase cytochrome subunit
VKRVTLLSLAALVCTALPAAMAQADAGALAKKCDSCHGKDGVSQDGKVPNIGGMSAYFLNKVLIAFAKGDRKGVRYKPKDGEESDMSQVAKGLTDEDRTAITAHYAAKTFVRHPQTVDAAEAARGKHLFARYCEKCHSQGGTVADDDASLLMGQWRPYLQAQFTSFEKGTRPMPRKMARRFEHLHGKDQTDILEYLVNGKE